MSDTVPVFVESVKKYEHFAMTRCNYLTVECDDPSPNWQLILNGKSYSALMLGMSAIITSPIGKSRFEASDEIESLIATVESKDGGNLFIDSNDIWLPNSLFKGEYEWSEGMGRNAVFRVGQKLFSSALKFREGAIDQENFIGLCEEFQNQITLSYDESKAFHSWHWKTIDNVREIYHKRKLESLVLRTRRTNKSKGKGL